MPFVSKAQRRMMYAKHPEIAKRWEKETPNKPLPERKGKTKSQKHKEQLHRGMQGKHI